MFTLRRLCATCFLMLCLVITVLAQAQSSTVGPKAGQTSISQTNTTVTASATAERVRFTSPSSVVRMQLQVISETGQVLFDVSSKGNVLDWSLQDSSGQRLQGSYLTVVTVKSISGRLSQRIGTVSVEEKQVELKAGNASGLEGAQQLAVGPIEENATLTILKEDEAPPVTVLANDGKDGQLIRGQGALSFRLGDFFSGKDTEQMRLTEEGNLGIGTDTPQAKLDVAGVIRTSKGIEFDNGTNVTRLTTTAAGTLQQTLADGTVVTNATGTGTLDRLAKWAETGGAGTLTDSVITETSGKVGIGVNNPTYRLVVGPDIGPGLTTSDLTISRGPGQSVSIFAGATGAHGMNFGWDEANQRAFVNAPVQSPITFTHGGVNERMRIATNGNTGIGNNNPQSLLDVAGNINTSTQYNIGGDRVLSVPGTNNAFVGVNAGVNNTGDRNSFFGRGAGFSNADGFGNAFFGYQAGNNNLDGIYNSFFGGSAGFNNTSGFGNSFFGYEAGLKNTDGRANSFYGSSAGESSTTGINNAFFGYGAGLNNKGGTSNSFFGRTAGITNVSGDFNTVIGEGADLGSGGLSYATAIGSGAIVSSSNTIALGRADGSDTVDVPGKLQIDTMATGGGQPLCLNSFNRVTLCPTSSLRYKTQVQSFLGGLNIVRRLRPITFTWKEDGSRDLGLGAEEVERVEPLLTFRNKRGQIQGVKYNQLIAVFVNAFKEQQQQIQELQRQLMSLKSRVGKYHRQVAIHR